MAPFNYCSNKPLIYFKLCCDSVKRLRFNVDFGELLNLLKSKVFCFAFDYWKIYFMSLFETKNEFNESAF